MTNRRQFLKTSSLAAAGALAAPALRAAPASAATSLAPRPNIVLILVDDMGYSDIGCYGGEIETPNLDRLAREGVRFGQFHNNARCCPTRAALITGLYSHQAGIGGMTSDQGVDGYRGNLADSAVTIAQVLKPAGYGTYAAGKWHLTSNTKPKTPEQKFCWPLQRGFDRYFGMIAGADDYFKPASLVRDNEPIQAEGDFYLTDQIGDHAIRFVEEHRARRPGDPFFLYMAFTAPHYPLQARPEDIAKYKGRYAKGWDALRQERYDRMVKLGLIDPKWKLSPRDPKVPAWDAAPDKEYKQTLMEIYAAMVDRMDRNVGRLVAALEKFGVADNTLVMFLSDNGACHLHVANPKQKAQPGAAGFQGAYGIEWANLGNTPFRWFKQFEHEGGSATPMIAWWPKGIRGADGGQSGGRVTDQLGHIVDVMPTCVEVAGATYPAQFNGHAIAPMEGYSLMPVFRGETFERGKPLIFEHVGNRALRDGKWKLVATGRGDWELYDMDADRTELNDLSQQFPERAKQMAETWEREAARVKILPKPAGKRPSKTDAASATTGTATESGRKPRRSKDKKDEKQ